MLVLSTIMSLLIGSGCVISAALFLILFIGDRKKEYLYIALFMLSQYLIELMVRGYETGSPIYYYLHSYFSAPVVIKSLLYCASVFLICCLFRRVIDKPRAWILVPVEVLLFIWLVMFPLLGVRTGFLYVCYLLPFQLLVIVLAFIGSKSFGGVTQKSIFLKLDVFLRVVGILGIVIVFEDVVTGLYYGLGNDVAGLVASGAIRSRNIGENIFQIIIAAYLIAVAGHFFVGKIAAKPIHDEGSTERLPEEVVDTYATSVGLSLREREILGFLLEEKSAQEISELLFISVGTVKSHTHNIYQKAGVGNRMQLLQKIKICSAD